MQKDCEALRKIEYLTGSFDLAVDLFKVPPKALFDDRLLDYLDDVSKKLLRDREAKSFPDVITFAFWIRKANLVKLKERFDKDDEVRLGKGVVFHIAPSNVPVNFAYSLVAGLLSGDANVVRVPSKDFAQVRMITDAFNSVLEGYSDLRRYIICVRYGRDKEINDLFSSMADMRVIWGGDRTIEEIRKSPLPPRSGEITFADRFSLAVIDSDKYMELEDKKKAAEDFYNDTFLFDQNACTSPHLIVWTGGCTEEAKRLFWENEQSLVSQRYGLQPVQAVDKVTALCLACAGIPDLKVVKSEDNLIFRIRVGEPGNGLMDHRGNSGLFYEYDCDDICELKTLCDDKRCQTITYIGSRDMFIPLIKSGIKGIDRIVPMGKSMDFDLLWDGYDLPGMLSRTVAVL